MATNHMDQGGEPAAYDEGEKTIHGAVKVEVLSMLGTRSTRTFASGPTSAQLRLRHFGTAGWQSLTYERRHPFDTPAATFLYL